jgi:hypothetical protein
MIQYQHVAQISENVRVHSRKQTLGIQEQADLLMEAKRLLELFHSNVQHMLRVNGQNGTVVNSPSDSTSKLACTILYHIYAASQLPHVPKSAHCSAVAYQWSWNLRKTAGKFGRSRDSWANSFLGHQLLVISFWKISVSTRNL